MNLRKQTSLHLLGDFDLLGSTAFGLELFDQRPAVGFHPAGKFVKSCQTEAVAIRISEAGVDPSPARNSK